MPEPAAHERDAFLQRIADRLPFDEAEKLDILRELAGHLADSTAQFEADGLTRGAAERAALDRLGPPDRLADALTEARHSPRRLLAAAGAGTWAAVSGVVYGYFFALLVLLAASFATVLFLHLFGGSWGSLLDTTTTTPIALGVGAYAAGLKVTPVVAARAGYPIRTARRVTAVLGGALILGYALVGWKGALNWPEVGILLALPAWFVVGAWRATDARFPPRQWRLRIIALALVIVPLALIMGMSVQPQSSGSITIEPNDVGRIGLPTPEAVAATQDIGSGGARAGGIVWISTVVRDPAVLAGWRDLRVEAWRGISKDGVDPAVMPVLDPAAHGPFTVGPVRFERPGQGPLGSWGTDRPFPDGAIQLGGSITIDRNPTVTLAWVAITGVGPDGRRYIINGPSYASTAFNGTAWDWLTAVIEGR